MSKIINTRCAGFARPGFAQNDYITRVKKDDQILFYFSKGQRLTWLKKMYYTWVLQT